MLVSRNGGQDGCLLPSKAISSFPVGGEMRPAPLCLLPPPPTAPPVTGGDLRGSGHSLLSIEPLYITWSVLPSDLHLYFMQNGSCEGCQLEGRCGLRATGRCLWSRGSSWALFFPRGLDSG